MFLRSVRNWLFGNKMELNVDSENIPDVDMGLKDTDVLMMPELASVIADTVADTLESIPTEASLVLDNLDEICLADSELLSSSAERVVTLGSDEISGVNKRGRYLMERQICIGL